MNAIVIRYVTYQLTGYFFQYYMYMADYILFFSMKKAEHALKWLMLTENALKIQEKKNLKDS